MREYLAAHNLSAYKLAKAMGSATRVGTVYRLARESSPPSRVDLPTLARVLDGLAALTGHEVSVADLLRYRED